ncbi:unnamed protein product [Blepharisma stoltei]|uniref:Myosin motor domain-containing protein n=1 Tax=Blepharisma stoltei TaxID=1481888 RepID=A0AAU9IUT4_9CILI|nr:unnamed protein product [Blepharisma stoltei]
MEFVLGDLIWIYPHDELSWAPGEITSIEENAYVVSVKDFPDSDLYRVEKQHALPVHPSCLEGIPDLLSLGEFNLGALLHNVRTRYFQNNIYTSVGSPILISINPYTKLPIYTQKHAEMYRGKGKENLAPHLYLMAEQAHSALLESNQSIIISGESGSGKTEAAKIILSYLAGFSGEASKGGNSIENQVLDSNPILEAFGNAKTLRNDNSSRFGKFIEIHFDSVTRKLHSARIENYLLEKSRIVTQIEGERNYHFFYQLCAGANDTERELFKILSAESYNYLCKGGCLEIPDVDDAENYQQTRECMKILGFTEQEQMDILRIVTGVLYMGNLEFVGEENAEIENYEILEIIANLLKIPVKAVEKILTTRIMIDPMTKKEIEMLQNPGQAMYIRDATSKAIYSKLFVWLVNRINESIAVKQKKTTKIIGLLDIYGFEVFEDNSYEQLCINYANEKLQQHFNHHMFKLEQSEYSKEKIKWDHISYEDNQLCIDLIEKKPIGVIALLDEQCKLQRGSDKTFLSNLHSMKEKSNYLCDPGQFANDYFGISHYAGNVFYNVNGFCEKNKDTLNPEIIKAVDLSECELLRLIFTEPKVKKSRGKKDGSTPGTLNAPTIATQFKGQLHDLMKALSAATPSYIRCIKPNSHKSPKEFDSVDVERQLRCAGMLESIRIRKAGYSVRRSIQEFVGKYWILAPSIKKQSMSNMAQCKELFGVLMKNPSLRNMLDPDKKLCQIGITKVFMKDELRQAIDVEYAKAAHGHAVRIQALFRGHKQKKKYQFLYVCVLCLQKNIRNFLWRRKLGRKIEAKKKLKRWIASLTCKERKNRMIRAVEIIERGVRRALCREIIKKIACENKEKEMKKAEEIKDEVRLEEVKRVEIQKEETKIEVTSSDNSEKSQEIYMKDQIKYKNLYEKTESSTTEETEDFEVSIRQINERPRNLSHRELISGNAPVIETLKQEISSLTSKLTYEREKTSELEGQVEHYRKLYESALEQLHNAQSDKRNFTITLDRESKKLSGDPDLKLARDLAAKDNEISMLQLKLDAANHQCEELEEYNRELKGKESSWRQKLEQEVIKHTQEMQALRIQLSQKPAEIERSDNDKEIKILKQNLRSLESENSSLKSQMKSLDEELSETRNNETRIRDQLKKAQDEYTSKANKLSKAESENYENIQKQLQQNLEELQKVVDSQRDENEELHEEMETLKGDVNRMASLERFYKDEISKLQKQNKDKHQQLKDLESQLEQLHTEKLELSKQKIEQDALIAHLQNSEEEKRNAKKLKSTIEAQEEEIEELAKELEASKQVYATLVTLLKFKNTEIEHYKNWQAGRTDKDYQKEIGDLKYQEQNLLEKLDEQMTALNAEEEDTSEEDD